MNEAAQHNSDEKGFSLIEVVIALTILLIALLGVLTTITYAITYNTGNSLRSQSLAVMQQQIEILQSAKYNPTVTDQILSGGLKSPAVVKSADGNIFRVEIAVDDNPFAAGVQTDSAKTLKEISIVVTPETSVGGWQNSAAAKVTIRRVRGN